MPSTDPCIKISTYDVNMPIFDQLELLRNAVLQLSKMGYQIRMVAAKPAWSSPLIMLNTPFLEYGGVVEHTINEQAQTATSKKTYFACSISWPHVPI